MKSMFDRTRLLVSFFVASAMIVAGAISSGFVALNDMPQPDSPVTIRANGDTAPLASADAERGAPQK